MNKRTTVSVSLAAAAIAAGVLASVAPASAHGYPSSPFESRQAICHKGNDWGNVKDDGTGLNPESVSIKDPACRAAFAEGVRNQGGGPAARAAVANAFNQPQSVLQGSSTVDGISGQHRTLIPDGKLASANNGGGEYSGFDLPRADWTRSTLRSGAEVELSYHATAHHAGGHIEYYVTKDGVDLSKPLQWDDLEPIPFAYVSDPNLSDKTETRNKNVYSGNYKFKVKLPEKDGDHIIYTIWQREAGSAETFYAVSDVTFVK